MPRLFSIIIPTCHRNELLALCLNRLAPGMQTLNAALYEVIVTDDGKNNEAKELIEQNYPWVRWTAGPKRGPAANRNNGARLAAGEWLVFTDDDCLPDANWLQAYADAIVQNPDCKAFEGAILPNDWNLLKKDMAECPVNDKGGCFWSANIMVEKNLYWEVGGFDEQFTIAAQEDQDLKNSILVLSKIMFDEKAIVIHPVRKIQLKRKIHNLPLSLKNWIRYERKSRHSIIQIWRKGIRSQSLALISSAQKGKPGKVIEHFATLVFSCFFIPYYASKNCK